MPGTSHKPRIFVSHSHKDNEFGIQLVDDLKQALGDESAVWYDSRGGLKGGDIWWNEIVRELKRRNIFIVILSPNSVAARWVQKEMRMALMHNVQKNKKIIPILHQPCKIPDDYQDIHAVSFLNDRTYEEAFEELKRALNIKNAQPHPHNISSFRERQRDKLQQLIQEIEISYSIKDWSGVINKTHALTHQYLEAVPFSVYSMQGWAYYYTNQPSLAQEAVLKAINLIPDAQKQLKVLDIYTAELVSNGQWDQIVPFTDQALRLDPYNSVWQTLRKDALARISRQESIVSGQLEEEKAKIRRKERDADLGTHTEYILSNKNQHSPFQNEQIEHLYTNQQLQEIELQKQKLLLQKEQFQFEKEIMAFALEMATKLADVSIDENSSTKVQLLRAFHPQRFSLENEKES